MRPPLDRSRLDEAKRRVPLSTAARALGLGELKPRGVQRSPFREDRHPSFSVTGDALWRDHATGEGGDVVSFIVRASGCEDGEAIKRLLALAGLDEGLDLAPSGSHPGLRLRPRHPSATPCAASICVSPQSENWRGSSTPAAGLSSPVSKSPPAVASYMLLTFATGARSWRLGF